MKEKKSKLGFKLILLALLLLPGMQVLAIIGLNSNYFIRKPFFILIILLILLLLISLLYGVSLFQKNKKSNKRKLKKWVKIVFSIFMIVYVTGCIVLTMLLYGPSEKFRSWLITTAMATMEHQYYCKIFYNDAQIKEIMDKNFIKEPEENTNKDLINQEQKVEYKNEDERKLMEHEEGELYKVVTFEVNSAKAYMTAIYDPSKVKLAVTSRIGVMGEYVTEMMRKNNAIIGVNAGGFVDNGNNMGESPTGITIVDKKIVTNNQYGYAPPSGGIIGMTDDNVLVLLKNVTAEEALAQGVRDAVSWGPFLIVNGVSAQVSGNGGWGGGARSAIGQRKDGTILLLVVDSNSIRTSGAKMNDLVDIMERYGAYNAANLDGGTSSVLDFRRDIATRDFGADCHDYWSSYACHINDPIDATGAHKTRYIADAWVVVE